MLVSLSIIISLVIYLYNTINNGETDIGRPVSVDDSSALSAVVCDCNQSLPFSWLPMPPDCMVANVTKRSHQPDLSRSVVAADLRVIINSHRLQTTATATLNTMICHPHHLWQLNENHHHQLASPKITDTNNSSTMNKHQMNYINQQNYTTGQYYYAIQPWPYWPRKRGQIYKLLDRDIRFNFLSGYEQFSLAEPHLIANYEHDAIFIDPPFANITPIQIATCLQIIIIVKQEIKIRFTCMQHTIHVGRRSYQKQWTYYVFQSWYGNGDCHIRRVLVRVHRIVYGYTDPDRLQAVIS